MLVRNVVPLLSDGMVVFVDRLGKLVWSGMKGDVAEETGLLPLVVDAIEFDNYCNAFVVSVHNGSEEFHEIELLLSDCLRYADEGRMVNYVAIMHLARRVAQIAETSYAKMIGR